MKRLPKMIKFEELKSLNTKRLLSYMKLLHKCEESFEESDFDINPDLKKDNTIQFKNTEKWKLAYQSVKLLLKERGNIKKN